MAISNSMDAAGAAASTAAAAPPVTAPPRSSAHVADVAQHTFEEFQVHYDPKTSDVHIIHASQVAIPEVAGRIKQLASHSLTTEQIRQKEQMAQVGQAKVAVIEREIAELDPKIQKLETMIAKLDAEIAQCDASIQEKTHKSGLSKLLQKSEAEIQQLQQNKSRLLGAREGLSNKKAGLSAQKNGALARKKAVETGTEMAQSAASTGRQVLQFRENLQSKLVQAEQRFQELGCREHEGRVIISTPQGPYDLGLSAAAFKLMLAVSMITDDVAQDRIILVQTAGKDGAKLDTPHTFYQIRAKGDDAASVMHKGDLRGKGGKGIIFKALDVATQQVRALKEMKNPEDEDIHEEVKIEYDMSRAANPDNTRAGIQHKPHACFDLRREGFGGIGLVFDFANLGDLKKNLDRVTVQDQAQGLLALFRANKTLSANNLLHLDVKPENVFVSGGPDGLSMVVADFDGMWKLDVSTDVAFARIDVKGVPENSSNSCKEEFIARLEGLKKEMRALKEEHATAEPNSEQALVLEKKLHALIDSYNTTATCGQTWGVAFTALQLLTQTYSKTFKDQETLIDTLQKRIDQCQDGPEKQFLEAARDKLVPILRAQPPKVDAESGKINSDVISPRQALRDVSMLVSTFTGEDVTERESPAAQAAAAPPKSQRPPEGAALKSQRISKGRPPSPPAPAQSGRRGW